jgi:predicted phosphodiesterase
VIVAVFADVHGNLPALETFIERTRGKADTYLCLGDVVNYGPWNNECLERVHALPGIVHLEGNHERLFLGKDDIRKERPLVQEFFDCSIRNFARRDLIGNLPASYELGSFLCSHTLEERTVYADTPIEIDRNRLIAHAHHAYQVQRSGRQLVNCGSIGQNRRCIDRLNYALYDSRADSFTLCEEPYSSEPLILEMVARGYPQRCIDYYLGKRRPAPSEAAP